MRVAIVQARMGSTRLPGKVMADIEGRTLLGHVLARVASCPTLDRTVVATTRSGADDCIEAEAAAWGTETYRGSEDDVLARYAEAAERYDASLVVRVTADCPLFDPDLLTAMLARWTATEAAGEAIDYLSNSLTRTFPRGLDAEIFTAGALRAARRAAARDYEREHVTPYIYEHPEQFTLAGYVNNEDLSAYRLTVDTPEDLALVRAIYAELWDGASVFSTAAVVALLRRRPELTEINRHVRQKELGA